MFWLWLKWCDAFGFFNLLNLLDDSSRKCGMFPAIAGVGFFKDCVQTIDALQLVSNLILLHAGVAEINSGNENPSSEIIPHGGQLRWRSTLELDHVLVIAGFIASVLAAREARLGWKRDDLAAEVALEDLLLFGDRSFAFHRFLVDIIQGIYAS